MLVFSKPQIFEKQIGMFSSSLDRALLGQRVPKGDQWEWAEHGGRCEEIPLAGAFSCRQGRGGDCVYGVWACVLIGIYQCIQVHSLLCISLDPYEPISHGQPDPFGVLGICICVSSTALKV